MTAWRIVRVTSGHEAAVDAELRRMVIDVRTWIPELLIVLRPRRTRLSQTPARRVYRLPLPGYVFAALAVADMGVLQRLRYCDGVWRDGDDNPVAVPGEQVAAFMTAVQDYNARQEAYFRHLTTARAVKRPERFRGFDRLAEALQARQAMDDAL